MLLQDVTPCSFVDSYQISSGMYHHILKFIATKKHGVTFQDSMILKDGNGHGHGANDGGNGDNGVLFVTDL
jgi:hypothetical protein